MYTVSKLSWVHSLIPGLEKLAVEYHCGNYVVKRGSTEPFFESMPLFARIGMHLLFYGNEQIKLLGNKRIDELLHEESIRQGKIYDDPKSAKSIPSFIETYSIQINELLEPDISKYRNFNEFFFRKLRPDARPIENQDDDSVIVSAADCRLTVFTSVDVAKAFWVKGQNFNIHNLLNIPADSPKLEPLKGASIAIFRLAPADYHRFHSPIDCEVGDIEFVQGQFYTVNPQAINEPGFDVLTANVRSILYLKHIPTGKLVAFVAIGALLVGSIQWTGGKEKGTLLKRGDELGHFAYGGSTIVVVFPKEVAHFDEDLVSNSQKPIETLVQVGYSIGKTPMRKRSTSQCVQQ
ncbi:phosphatidylserine decarboxylase-domain-containing protein [Flammula alnicola]|nr:phosphatidylserine decarboxylase-domain-containing protein [Flammula alnicola]